MAEQKITKELIEETRKASVAFYKYIHSDREYLRDARLYLREIHVLTLVGENPDLTMSEIGEKMGITQGAVSQIAARLLNKGMVRKVKNSVNRRFTTLELTDAGQKAYRDYLEFGEKRSEEISSYFKDFSEEDFDLIIRYEKIVQDICEGRIAKTTLPLERKGS